MSENSEQEISEAVRQQIERNRQKAIIIRQSKLVPHPYAKGRVISIDTTTLKIGMVKYKDTGGGFLLEERPESDEVPVNIAPLREAPLLGPDRPTCKICNKLFATSWLFDKFSFKCCDTCRDPKVHKLISKSSAKESYLLKDCDFDKREPPLRFILQKNPHNARWGDMKLYLQNQVEERALEVWGSEEEIEKEKERREEKRVMAKSKRYEKRMKELRKGERSGLYDRSDQFHRHEFGPESYNEEEDTYHRKCTTCPYEETFEKM